MSSVAPARPDKGEAPPPSRGGVTDRIFSVNLRQSGIYVAFALIVALFAILTHGSLLSPENMSNVLVQNSYILILSIGMILVIIAGHIDLSAGSVVDHQHGGDRTADGDHRAVRRRGPTLARVKHSHALFQVRRLAQRTEPVLHSPPSNGCLLDNGAV